MFEYALFGVAWWVLLLGLISFGVLTTITAWEKPISGLVFFVAAFIGLAFLQGVNPLAWVTDNASTVGGWLLGYLLVGIAYAYAKWTWFYLPSKEVQDQIADAFRSFKRNIPAGVQTEDEMIANFEKSSQYPFGLRKDKWRISTWVLWWPMNLFWTLLDDVLIGLVNWFANALSGSFAAIARNQVRKTLKSVE